jgi:hypothetical protein
MYCLRSLGSRDRGFESHTRYGCLVCVFILCLCCPVFRQRSCDELITRPRSPTVCKMIMKLKNQRSGPQGGCGASGKKCIGEKAGWAPEPVWTTWRGEKFCRYRDSTPNPRPPSPQPVAIPTVLSGHPYNKKN